MRYATQLMTAEENIKKQWADKNGIKFAFSTPADEQIILKAGNDANDSYFKKLEGEGAKNVRQVVNYYTQARKKYEAENAKK